MLGQLPPLSCTLLFFSFGWLSAQPLISTRGIGSSQGAGTTRRTQATSNHGSNNCSTSPMHSVFQVAVLVSPNHQSLPSSSASAHILVMGASCIVVPGWHAWWQSYVSWLSIMSLRSSPRLLQTQTPLPFGLTTMQPVVSPIECQTLSDLSSQPRFVSQDTMLVKAPLEHP